MNHRQTLQRLPALYDGELTCDEARAVRRHLDACSECAAEWRAFDGVLTGLRNAPRVALDPAHVAAVMARVRTAPASKVRVGVLRGAALCAARCVAHPLTTHAAALAAGAVAVWFVLPRDAGARVDATVDATSVEVATAGHLDADPPAHNHTPRPRPDPVLIRHEGERILITTQGPLEDVVVALLARVDDPNPTVRAAVELRLDDIADELGVDRARVATVGRDSEPWWRSSRGQAAALVANHTDTQRGGTSESWPEWWSRARVALGE